MIGPVRRKPIDCPHCMMLVVLLEEQWEVSYQYVPSYSREYLLVNYTIPSCAISRGSISVSKVRL